MQLRLGRHKERGSKLSECSMQRDFPHLQGDKMGKEMPRSGKNKQHEQHNSTSSFFFEETVMAVLYGLASKWREDVEQRSSQPGFSPLTLSFPSPQPSPIPKILPSPSICIYANNTGCFPSWRQSSAFPPLGHKCWERAEAAGKRTTTTPEQGIRSWKNVD